MDSSIRETTSSASTSCAGSSSVVGIRRKQLLLEIIHEWMLVLERLLKYLARRKRHITLKCAVAVTGILIFTVYFTWAVLLSPKSRRAPNELQKLRDKALLENTDEFIESVLNKLSYDEVDLYARSELDYDEYDEEIEADERRQDEELGEDGKAATVPYSLNATAEEMMKKEAFNRLLGDMISYNRSTPDVRDPECFTEVYDSDLPDMTVVIVFTNEALSSLLRTVHSVINRTPRQFLREIVLVDDFSDKKDLKGKLERYLAKKLELHLDKIRLIRLRERSGLIRTRMMGAHFAIGDVIVFLDAHCEATDGWAEPMLQRLKDKRNAVVTPVIESINDRTLEFSTNDGDVQIGGFNWDGDFTWIKVPAYEKRRRKSPHSPTRSPTMAGGLFAINRKYFWEIGSYDPGMTYWGGENLEISFRIWQCGGVLETIPCSKVGHIFREFQPYSFPKGVDSHGVNTARLAEVWMDEFKDLFYSNRKGLKKKDIGDISGRLAFRKRKKCKGFKWFLDNIYKEKFRLWLSAFHYGQFKNPISGECLDNMQNKDEVDYTLASYPCHDKLGTSQIFAISKKYEFRKEEMCGYVESGWDTVLMTMCDNYEKNDKWEFRAATGQLYHKKSKKCLTVRLDAEDTPNPNRTVFLEPCEEPGTFDEQWSFQHWTVDPHEGEDEAEEEVEEELPVE